MTAAERRRVGPAGRRAGRSAAVAALLSASLLAACTTAPPERGATAPTPEASSGAAEPAFELVPFRWRAEATPQAAIHASNAWGDVRVRTAARGGLAVSAMIQKIGSAADELEVRIDEGEDAVTIEVVRLVPAPRGRVDLTLIIPPGKRLEAETRDGLAEIKYKGEVDVRSRGGALLIQGATHAFAESETGNVTARLPAPPETTTQTLATDSGNVELWLPRDANAVVRAETAGAIDLAEGEEAEAERKAGPPSAERTLGAGGPEILLESESGSVRLVLYEG